MRTQAIRSTLVRRLSAGVPIGMMLAAPAYAANFVLPPDWPNYLLVASIAALALGLTVRALEGRGGPRHTDGMSGSDDSIDAYRNRALKP